MIKNLVVSMNRFIFRVMTKDNIAIAALLQTREACWEANAQPDASQVCKVLFLLNYFTSARPSVSDSPYRYRYVIFVLSKVLTSTLNMWILTLMIPRKIRYNIKSEASL